MAAVEGTAEHVISARSLMRAVLPAGQLLLVVWLIWVGLPFVMGAQRRDLSPAQAVVFLAVALALIALGERYRRAFPSFGPRDARAYEAGRPHPYFPIEDAGVAALTSGVAQSRWGANADQLAMTNRYQRMDGCAVPGCGRRLDAEIHAPVE